MTQIKKTWKLKKDYYICTRFKTFLKKRYNYNKNEKYTQTYGQLSTEQSVVV